VKLPYFQVDAFASRSFTGNPAGVCPLRDWLPDELMQKIAMENNLSETAFVVKRAEQWDLRWFTPAVEVDLCGHATLATAFVLHLEDPKLENPVRFSSRSGILSVAREKDLFVLDFPSRPAQPVPCPDKLIAGLGSKPAQVLKASDYLAVFDSEEQVREIKPDFGQLAELDCVGIIASAPGKNADFVSRFFAPRAGVPEDPVTGRAHCTLIPYWAQRRGKSQLHALQVSKRGGELFCEAAGERVKIGGRAVLYSRAEIEFDTKL
jgi:PhzF family phenazine biosynthesis protein